MYDPIQIQKVGILGVEKLKDIRLNYKNVNELSHLFKKSIIMLKVLMSKFI